MNQKRSLIEVDADYQEFDVLTEHQSKRQKLLEHDAKEAAIKKMKAVIRREFVEDLSAKEAEINLIDERINEGRRLLDRLRACIVAQHYSKVIPNGTNASSNPLLESQSSTIHPAVKKFLGKTIKSARHASQAVTTPLPEVKSRSFSTAIDPQDRSSNKPISQGTHGEDDNSEPIEQCRGDRFKIIKKIIVGNVSKYLGLDKKEDNDRSTHKWMVYVRAPKGDPPIEELVEKVTFFLHNSYWPNNVVEMTQPPFHLTRRGWGEFPMQVQLHCKGQSKRIFNITHQLKLDRTYTGLQTIGSETVVEIKLDKEVDSSAMGRFNNILRSPQDGSSWQDEVLIKRENVNDDYGDLPEHSTTNSNEYCDVATHRGTNRGRLKAESAASSERRSLEPSSLQQLRTSLEKRGCTPDSNTRSSNSSASCMSEYSPISKPSDATSHCVIAPTNDEENINHTESRCIIPARVNNRIISPDSESREIPGVVSTALSEVRERDRTVVCEETRASADGREDTENNFTIKIEPIEPESESDRKFSDTCSEVGPDMEQVSCDDIEEEVVLGDTICVEPVPEDDACAYDESSENVKSDRADFAKRSKTPNFCGEIGAKESVLDAVFSLTVSNDFSETKEPVKTEEQEEFMRCIDSTGRIFKIPRKLMKSSLAIDLKTSSVIVKTTNTKSKFSASFVTATSSSSPTTNTVTIATGSQVLSPRHLTSLNLVESRTANAPGQVQKLGVNRILSLGGEFPVLKKTKPESVLNTSAFLVAGNKPGAARKLSNDAVFVVPQSCSSSLSSLPNKLVISPRFGSEQRSVALLTPGGARELVSSDVQVLVPSRSQATGSQIVPMRNGTVLYGSQLAVVPNNVPLKAVSMQSLGLRGSFQPAVLNKNKLEETGLKISQPLSLLSSKQLGGGPTVSSPSFVRVLSCPSTSSVVKVSSPSGLELAQTCGLVTKSVVNSRGRSVIQSSPCKSVPPPVYLIVPSVNSKTHVQVSSSFPVQSSARPLVLLSKGGAKDFSTATPNARPPRFHSQHISTPDHSSGGQIGEENLSAKKVSILRPPGGQMTSLLKKPASTLGSAKFSGNVEGTSDLAGSNALPKCDQTVIKTQIGNQTVVIKLDPIEEAKRRQLDSRSKTQPQALTNLSPQPKSAVLPPVVSCEKHLMFKSVREAQKRLTTDGVNPEKYFELDDLATMEDLVRSVVKCHPIYSENVDRSMHPYCAPSWNAFLQWKIGKRRASELCRAVAVLRKISLLLNGESMFRGESVWSKRKLILWCRHNIYTPFENEMIDYWKGGDSKQNVFESLNHAESHLSLTDHREAVSRLDMLSKTITMVNDDQTDDTDDLYLDVVAADDAVDKMEKQKMPSAMVSARKSSASTIPPSLEAQFVQETAGKIGIRFSPLPVLPLECPDVTSSTSEEMIAAATSAFVNELIRAACSELYKNKRNPQELDVSAIYRSILRLKRCDFLTNRLLGVSEDESNLS